MAIREKHEEVKDEPMMSEYMEFEVMGSGEADAVPKKVSLFSSLTTMASGRKRDSWLADSAIWNNNYWTRPPYKADHVCVHIMTAQWTGDQCGRFFRSAKVSSNYGIGIKGDICQFVEEKYGAWAQGSKIWNQRTISIELANNGGAGKGWPVSSSTLQSCIELVADIYKRNGFGLVYYTGDTKGNLYKHRDVAQTSCPGPYVTGRMQYIADEANKLLKGKVRLPERGYYILGDKGMGVKNIQTFLKKQKLYTGKIGGNYKTLTFKAVKKFQKKYGLKVDGEWGKECQKQYEKLTK